MTAEQDALRWLGMWATEHQGHLVPINDAPKHVRTLKAMLAQPRLPSDPDFEFVRQTFKDWPLVIEEIRHYHRALYAHLAKPTLAEPRHENPELRFAINALRGWSAEAAGRSGLADSVLIVCNAAEATLPVQLYRIRAKDLDVVHAGPVSISEVPR